MDRLGVERVRLIATSAARDAANREDFLSAAEAATGVRPELLDGGAERAPLLRRGDRRAAVRRRAVPRRRHRRRVDRVRPRAGSAEPHEATGVVSIDVGCVRITERFLHGDPPRPEELSQAISVVHDYLDDVRRELPGVG